ncbi:chorismate-binding protein [Flammeovirgaceae bacterium SG7u.111]|nr:chorismate-binding protein [Flammeovirgaceae bacterium SG7u.132]WPO35992.1 chorismate-binding protein [Flammeovirgaceae bacterium SG7u.111]
MDITQGLDKPTTAKQTNLLSSLIDMACAENLSVAMWQLPGETEQHAIVDCSGQLNKVQPDLENLPEGFIASTFLRENPEDFFIRADIHFKSNEQELVERILPNQEWKIGQTRDEFIRKLKSVIVKNTPRYHSHSAAHYSISDKNHYIKMVEKSIGEIEAETFQKVVLSRNKTIELPEGFDIMSCFNRLCKAYPAAFVSLISLPGVGTWMGASPEILINTNEKGIFKTISLAGTQAKSKFDNICDASWTQKEIEEQAMVSRYVINCFKKIRLREFEEIGPKTVAAGSLLHLRTDYVVDTKAVNYPQLGSVMLGLLHPTSAICGMPKETSLDFILEHEDYERSFYSGYLGPVNVEGKTGIFVNLRCMQLLEKEAVLYAGAGITQDSVPEKEFMETEMKMNIMFSQLEG